MFDLVDREDVDGIDRRDERYIGLDRALPLGVREGPADKEVGAIRQIELVAYGGSPPKKTGARFGPRSWSQVSSFKS